MLLIPELSYFDSERDRKFSFWSTLKRYRVGYIVTTILSFMIIALIYVYFLNHYCLNIHILMLAILAVLGPMVLGLVLKEPILIFYICNVSHRMGHFLDLIKRRFSWKLMSCSEAE